MMSHCVHRMEKDACEALRTPGERWDREVFRATSRFVALSQTALADQIGVSFQQIQKYEKGTNRIGSSRLLHCRHFTSADRVLFRRRARPSEEERKRPIFDMPK